MIGGNYFRRMSETDHPPHPAFEPFRRYVPLVVWVIVVLTLLLVPLKIIGYGYLPGVSVAGVQARAALCRHA